MTTAIIGTGGLGSVIARQLASGGETLRLSSADIHACFLLADLDEDHYFTTG
jgi:predicted dinucleotide-binding enzyme